MFQHQSNYWLDCPQLPTYPSQFVPLVYQKYILLYMAYYNIYHDDITKVI